LNNHVANSFRFALVVCGEACSVTLGEGKMNQYYFKDGMMKNLMCNAYVHFYPRFIISYFIKTSAFTVLCLFFSAMVLMAQSSIRRQNFDQDWKFSLDADEAASKVLFDDGDWRNLSLPHDWSIEGVISPNNPMGNDGGYFPAGIGWYRKNFNVPKSWKGKLISIQFDGIYMNAEVFINGTSLGVHPYGYTTFSHDLTPYIKFGIDNVISVRVDNSQQKNSRWYSGSGIYRHVWLEVTNSIHLDEWGVIITTPSVDHDKSMVQITSRIINETNKNYTLELQSELKDNQNVSVGTVSSKVVVMANSEIDHVQRKEIKNPKLWSHDSPELYQAAVTIKSAKGNVLDHSSVAFGIRKLEFNAKDGFKLNGQSILLNGGCVHHDNGCLGAAAFDRAEIRKVELLKAGGYNAVRTSHNPPSEAFLSACDRLGLLVIDEAFDGWRASKTTYDYAQNFDEWATKDIAAMVKRDRNHPSIIMWSIGNEIIERTNPEAIETARMLKAEVQKHDVTRPVTSAMTTWGQGWDVFDSLFAVHDIGGYNYQLHEAKRDHVRVPDRIILQTESYPRDAFYCWSMVQKHIYIIGDFVWTAMDYLGESGIGRYHYPNELAGQHWEKDFFPNHGAYCGDIDLIGWQKPIGHYRSMLYNEDKEKLYLAVKEPNPANGKITVTDWAVWPTWESWTWPDHVDDTLQVEVYSRYDVVRLYQDQKLVAEKRTGLAQEYKAIFDVKYVPGTITAVGILDGKEVESRTLQTAGNVASCKLKADQETLKANGQDLVFVTIELIDEKGIMQPNASNLLEFSLDGPGEIIGVGNADLNDTDSYVGKTRKAWKGRSLVVIRSTHDSGVIRLSVKSDNMLESVLSIYCNK
jgi:beta-galactosidase